MIEALRLEYTYPARAQATLWNLHFSIERGEVFGFLGPSGAGKSTTQRILIGLLPGYRGEVHIKGKELSQYGTEYYESIGVGFELPNHFGKLTGLENLELFRSLYRQSTRDPLELLQLVGLAGDAHKRVAEYSKGMKMRLNFVRALLPDPELLFLDEPTAGLDPQNARRIKDLVLEMKDRGKTVFLTTHNMTDADELCDRVAFIVDGQIRLIDEPRALKVAHGARRVVTEHRKDGRLVRNEFDLGQLGSDERFARLLREEQLETIHSTEATLEDVFLAETGRRLQ